MAMTETDGARPWRGDARRLERGGLSSPGAGRRSGRGTSVGRGIAGAGLRAWLKVLVAVVAAAWLPGGVASAHTARVAPVLPVSPIVPPKLGPLEPARALQRYEYRRLVMGIEARLVFYTTDDTTAERAAAAAWARLDALDAALSDWRPDSELVRLSSGEVGAEQPVGSDLFAVLERAQELSRLTGGAFDVTVGPYVSVWRAARARGRLPDPEELADAAPAVGWQHLLLLPDEAGVAEPRAGRVVLQRPGMRLDLGGIAKGYAADAARAALAAAGVPRSLVELGGDLAAGEPPPDREAWETLAGCGEGRQVRVALRQQSLAVSGDSAQALVVEGAHYSHVVDPRSGQAAAQRTCCALLANEGALADALATAVQVLGPHDGRALLARHAPPGVRLAHLERLDRPAAALFHDPLRLARRLVPRLADGGDWTQEGELLVGRLGRAGAAAREAARFPAGASWELEFLARGDGGAVLLLHPLADHPEQAVVRVPVNSADWEHWQVHCTGFDPRILVWRQGELVLDEALQQPAVEGEGFAFSLEAAPVRGAATRAPPGQVALRELALRELVSLPEDGQIEERAAEVAVTELGDELGWTSLIDPTLSLWEVDRGDFVESPRDYPVVDGVLAIPSRAGNGQLRTKADYRDFRLRLDFKLAPGANSGLFLRGDRRGGDPAYSGCEVQIIDDYGWQALAGSALKPMQQCGSLYAAVAAAAPGVLKPAGEWNTYDVLYQGSRLAVALNGQVLYDVDTLQLAAEPPFAERAPTGFIGLQRYGALHVQGDTALWVRNMLVREL